MGNESTTSGGLPVVRVPTSYRSAPPILVDSIDDGCRPSVKVYRSGIVRSERDYQILAAYKLLAIKPCVVYVD